MNRRKTYGSGLWMQVVLWLILLLLPMWVVVITGESVPSGYWLTLAMQTGTWMVMFYLNYLLFIPRLLFRRRPWLFVAVNIVVALVLPYLVQVVYGMIIGEVAWSITAVDIISYGAVWLMFLFLIFAAISMRSMQRNRKLEAEHERRERELVSAELERLKSQLNPHFLFNSLNNISALSVIDPEATQEAIGTLSSMLRYVLYDSAAERVSLQGEVSFMQNYISLMSLRYTDKLHIATHWPKPAEGSGEVAPLLFISLIENAFKYGASSRNESSIEMSLEHTEGGTLTFTVSNTLNGEQASRVEPGAHGVGLVNLKRRLELLYPGAHRLECGLTADGSRYVAKLQIISVTTLSSDALT